MGVGDKRLFKAAEKLSLNGTTYFTRDQLICACFLKKERQSGFRFVAFILLSLISVLFGIFKIWPAAIIFLVMALVTAFSVRRGRKKDLVKAVDTYCRKVGHPFLLTPEVSVELMRKLGAMDFKEFHPERVLIVEDEDYAIQLLLNHFHIEQNCLVLTADKRPTSSFQYFKLRQKSDNPLSVYVFHDASQNSSRIVNRLEEDWEWGLNPEQLVDLGINPGNLTHCASGTWYNPVNHDVESHRKSSRFIQKKIDTGWRFPVDGLPVRKTQTALGYCMQNNCLFMSMAMLAAMPMLFGNPQRPQTESSVSSGSDDFDDFG